MSPETLEWIMGWTYTLLTSAAWGLFGFVMIKGRRRMRILYHPTPAAPEPPPLVSVIVPAKDEAGQIERCLSSVLAQDYPNFEIIAVNDRSSDATGAILDGLAVRDSRLRVVHIKPGALPPGWGGKSFAIHNGLSEARGEWLLFVDADVQLEPAALSASMAHAVKRQIDLLTLLPRFVSGSMSESVLQPLAGAATSAMFVIALTNSPQWPTTAFANGQFLLVKRKSYDAVGGHEAIRGTLSEDVAIARQMKAAGYKVKIGWGDEVATVRMYEGFKSIFRGWSRNFYVGSLGKPWRILGLLGFLIVFCFSLFVALAWAIYRHNHPAHDLAGWGWFAAVGVHGVFMTACIALLYRVTGERMHYALLFPLSAVYLSTVCLKSLWICMTGKVVWRGTQYAANELTPQVAPPKPSTSPTATHHAGT